MTDPTIDNLVTAAADLGRRDAERGLDCTTVHPDTALYITRVRNDEHVEVTNLEGLLDAPLRPRGDADLHDPADFAEYTNRLGHKETTTVWVDEDHGRIVAVFDDHGDSASAGWRQHRATLTLKADPDWRAWVNSDSKLDSQVWFAEHLDQLAHTVVSPDAATMLELAKKFQGKKSVAFTSGVRTDNGDVQLAYEETTTAKSGERGQVEIPSEFIIRITPFLGASPAEVHARLRYRINSGNLQIGYALIRPDLVRRDIMAGLVSSLRTQVDPFPVLMGTAPEKVSPASRS